MDRIEVLPSILSADFSRLGAQIQMVDKAGADAIHCDVMDGHFVPNMTFGPVVIKSVRKSTDLPFWTHLMISEPDKYIEPFIKAGSNGIYIHPETGHDMAKLSAQIRELGARPAISVNPDTPLKDVENVLPYFEKILIMTVYPGFGGQAFMESMLEKIEAFYQFIQQFDPVPVIEVDGGINLDTVQKVVKAGARSLVAGSNVFLAEDPAGMVKALREKGEAALI